MTCTTEREIPTKPDDSFFAEPDLMAKLARAVDSRNFDNGVFGQWLQEQADFLDGAIKAVDEKREREKPGSTDKSVDYHLLAGGPKEFLVRTQRDVPGEGFRTREIMLQDSSLPSTVNFEAGASGLTRVYGEIGWVEGGRITIGRFAVDMTNRADPKVVFASY